MKLKKNTFIQGAFIATAGIVICKILGMLYVIPFYSIVGDKGGALYGYAYSIYSIFLSISSAGIPLAMSKIISEYNALGYYNIKERTFKIGKKALSILGVLSFILLFVFARTIANIIIGGVEGGNSVEEVTLVIRVISTAILIVPILSVYRGYLQGHKFITPTSISQVIEQVIRVSIIIFGSFIALRMFDVSLTNTVAISVFAATPAAIISFLYLKAKEKNNQKLLNKKEINADEPSVSDKFLLKKILMYAFPFIMIDSFKTIYNSIDVMMLIKVLVNRIGFMVTEAETIMSVISTWGLKLNMIVIAVSTGVITSLIPNISESFIKKDMKAVNDRINKSLQILVYLTIPMVIGLSFLAKPVWMIFYGNSGLGASVYTYYVFVSLATIFFTTTITIVQLMKEYKQVFITLIISLILKVGLNIPLVYLFNMIKLPAYYGSITATILGFTIAGIISLVFLHKKYQITYKDTFKELIRVIIGIIIMIIVMFLLKLVLPVSAPSRVEAILIVSVYAIFGAVTYFIVTIKNKAFSQAFGNELIDKFKRKLKGKKNENN